ncbi:hypothetical protein FS837_003685 [Tulasnella sp. UAMH 9824]|nr:hypothetical protein FS837_003685 [Tulasnella sp. UAMH 9824]
MVHLSLTPLNGNQSASKGWPFQGVFGLTHITTHGTIRTRLGDDRTPLLASRIAIVVRCYETRLNRLGGVSQTNVLVERSQTLWSPDPSEQQQPPPFAPVGDLDLPFRFVLPPDLQGPSTCHMQDYRVFWRIEAVINHVPLVGQGTRQVKAFDLHFVRHDAPSSSGASSSTFHVSSARLPSCSYSLSAPSHPLGPEDAIPISLRVFTTQPAASLARVSVSVERRMEFRGESSKRSSSSSSKRDALPTPPSTASSMSSTDDPQQRHPTPLSATANSQPSSTKSKGKSKETSSLNLDQLGNSMLRATKRTTSYFLFSSSSSSTSSPSAAPSPSSSSALSAPAATTTPPAGSPVSSSPPTAPQVASDVVPFAFSVPTYTRPGVATSSPSASWGPAIPSPTTSATSPSQQPNSSLASPNNSTSAGNSPAATAPIGVVKTTTQTVATLEKVKADLSAIEPADEGVKWCLDTEEFCLPVQKPGHWSIGETMSTDLVAVRFFLCVKLTISTPTNPGSVSSLSSSASSSNWHSTEVVLPPHEIQVVSISAARRAYVLAKIEQTKANRAAAKSASASATTSPSGHLAPPSSSPATSRPTRRLRSSRDAHSPLASSSDREHQKKKSKKRLRGEREKDNKDALPSPPPSPYEFHVQLPDAASSTSSTVPLLRGHQPSRLVIPSRKEKDDDEDVKMDSPSKGSDDESSDDGFFVMSGDLSLQRMSKRLPKPSHASSPASASSRHQHNLRSSPRSPTLPSSPRAGSSSKSKSSRDARESKSKSPFKSFVSFGSSGTSARRPMTADGRRSADREMEMSQGYQRATSVGAVSPTNVLLLTERMGELMDLEEEDDRREDEDNPFSFSPPPPDMLPVLPDIHIQSPSVKSPTSSPASSASTVTIRQSPVPASTSAERANRAMALLEREWEEEFSRIESANPKSGEDFAGQCRKRRTRTRELAAAEE